MKIKDIENKIKNEVDKVDVPDVLDRVKKAPLNGGGGSKLFRKKVVLALLIITLVIFFVMSVAFFAFGIKSNNNSGSDVSYTYIGIKSEVVENTENIGIIVNEHGKAVLALNQTNLSVIEIDLNKELKNIVADLINPQLDGTVRIEILNDTASYASELDAVLTHHLNQVFAENSAQIRVNVSNAQYKASVVQFINANLSGSILSAQDSVEEIAMHYLSLAANLT